MNKNKSFLQGALFGVIAVFISKVLGLIYVIPFSRVATDENIAFFNYSYRIYAYILLIATAGIPFATATMIAKYNAKHNYLVSRKLLKNNLLLMLGIGLFFCILLIFMAPFLATMIAPPSQGFSVDYIAKVTTGIRIISTALIFVPMQSVARGFFQGYKEVNVSTTSQVIEQFFNSGLILLASGVFFVLARLNPLYLVYFAIFTATIASLASLTYLYFTYKKRIKFFDEYYNEGQRNGTNINIPIKELYKELLHFAVPYILVISLANTTDIIDLMFFNSGLTQHGLTPDQANELNGIYGLKVLKILTIPTMISIGFSTALIPHITEHFTMKNKQKLREVITQTIQITLYLLIPMATAFVFAAHDTYYVLFGNSGIKAGTFLIQSFGFVTIIITFNTVCNNMMLALQQRKRAIIFIGAGTIVKLSITYILIVKLGIVGMALSTLISLSITTILELILFKSMIKLSYRPILITVAKTILAAACMAAVGYYLSSINDQASYFKEIIDLTVIYLAMGATFLIMTIVLKIASPAMIEQIQPLLRKLKLVK